MSVITRLQGGAWDVLWCLNLTVHHENFCMLATRQYLSVQKLPLSAPDAKDVCQSSWVSKTEAGPLKKRKSTQAVRMALDSWQAS